MFCLKNVNKNKPRAYHINILGITIIILEKYLARISVKFFLNYFPHATPLGS